MSDLAERLWRARDSGGDVDPAAVEWPATDAQSYAVQAAVIALSGFQPIGFKIGSTSVEAQRLLGTTEPGSCPVLAPHYHESPARVPVFAAHHPAVEGEFAFRLGKDLPARAAPYEYDEVAGAVDAVAGAVEVVGTRLRGGLAGKGRHMVTADCGANIALITGAWHGDWRRLDLPSSPVGIAVNGEAAGRGTGARSLGDPLNVVVWLANQQSAFGNGLGRGMIISSGTCTGIDPVAAGDRVVADFGVLGTVAVDFT